MARCHVSVLIRETFIGKNYPDFDRKAFEKEYGKYCRCRWSEDRPLRALKHRIVKTIPEPTLYYDQPKKGSKGNGWGLAYSFNKCFDKGDKCIVDTHPTAIDMFAGAGGMSIGLEMGGFQVTHAVDIDNDAAATLKNNRLSLRRAAIKEGALGKNLEQDETIIFCQNAQSFIEEAKEAKTGSPYFCGDISHGHFSTPCQGCSRCNTTGKENIKRANNALSLTFPDLVISSKMITGSFENVSGLLDNENVMFKRCSVHSY